MLKIQLLSLVLLICCSITAQDPDIFTPVGDYCKPGIRWKAPSKGILIDFGIYPGTNIKAEGAEETNRLKNHIRSRYKLKVPIIHKDGISLLVGFNHYREQSDFSSIASKYYDLFRSIDNQVLKKSELGLYFNKALNEKFYLSFKISSSFNGDYDKLINFDNRYANHRIAAIFGYKKGPDEEIGFGIYAKKGFRNTRIYPIFLYNRTFNKKWGFHGVLPVQLRVRYSFSPKHILLTGTEYRSQDYSLDLIELNNDIDQVMHMRRSEFSISSEYFHQLSKWVWMSLKGGYVYHFKTEFTRLNEYSAVPDGNLAVRPSAGPFIKLGLFLSPPRY